MSDKQFDLSIYFRGKKDNLGSSEENATFCIYFRPFHGNQKGIEILRIQRNGYTFLDNDELDWKNKGKVKNAEFLVSDEIFQNSTDIIIIIKIPHSNEFSFHFKIDFSQAQDWDLRFEGYRKGNETKIEWIDQNNKAVNLIEPENENMEKQLLTASAHVRRDDLKKNDKIHEVDPNKITSAKDNENTDTSAIECHDEKVEEKSAPGTLSNSMKNDLKDEKTKESLIISQQKISDKTGVMKIEKDEETPKPVEETTDMDITTDDDESSSRNKSEEYSKSEKENKIFFQYLDNQIKEMQKTLSVIFASESEKIHEKFAGLENRISEAAEELKPMKLKIKNIERSNNKIIEVEENLRMLRDDLSEIFQFSFSDIIDGFSKNLFTKIASALSGDASSPPNSENNLTEYDELKHDLSNRMEKIKKAVSEFIPVLKEKLPQSERFARICANLESALVTDTNNLIPEFNDEIVGRTEITDKSWSTFLESRINSVRSDRTFSLHLTFRDYFEYLENEIQSLIKDHFATESEKQKALEHFRQKLNDKYIHFLKQKVLPALEAADKLLKSEDVLKETSNQDINVIMDKIDELAAVCELKEVDTNRMFDPDLHEAVGSEPSDKPRNSILESNYRGWMYGDKVILKAQVILSEVQK